ncbi:MarR family winged helix-turn-helix transcriptional regulator [Flindersiella endophytica]
MTTDDPLAEAELTFLLGMAFQLVLTEFNNRLAAAGYADLRPIHGMTFQALKGSGATSTELAERLGVTKQAAGQIVDDLESRGYVRRQPHPDGGRRKLVVLTDQAKEHLGIAGRTLHTLERQLGRRLGDPKLTELRVDLARLIRDLAGDSPPPLRPIW